MVRKMDYSEVPVGRIRENVDRVDQRTEGHHERLLATETGGGRPTVDIAQHIHLHGSVRGEDVQAPRCGCEWR